MAWANHDSVGGRHANPKDQQYWLDVLELNLPAFSKQEAAMVILRSAACSKPVEVVDPPRVRCSLPNITEGSTWTRTRWNVFSRRIFCVYGQWGEG